MTRPRTNPEGFPATEAFARGAAAASRARTEPGPTGGPAAGPAPAPAPRQPPYLTPGVQPPRTDPGGAPAPVASHGLQRPRTNPIAFPATDAFVRGADDTARRLHMSSVPLPPVDRVNAAPRPRTNPGPLPRDDDDGGAPVVTEATRPPRSAGTALRQDDTASRRLADLARPRTGPPIPRDEVDAGGRPVVEPTRPRTNPVPVQPGERTGSLGRPRTMPGPFPPVDIVTIPGRPRTQPGPIDPVSPSPPVAPGEGPRPAGRPRTNPGGVRQEYSAALDPRSEDSSITRPAPSPRPRTSPPILPLSSPAPSSYAPNHAATHAPVQTGAAPPARPALPAAPSHAAPTVARAWQDFRADGEASASPAGSPSAAARSRAREERQARPTEPAIPAADTRAIVRPATGATANTARTVARAWTDFQTGDDPPEPARPEPTRAPVGASPSDESRKPTQSLRAARGNAVNNAATVARSWDNYESDEEGADESASGDEPPANATRKVDWGGYGKVVATATPGPAGGDARSTQRVNAKEVERLRKEHQDKK